MNLSKRCHSYWYIKERFVGEMMQVFIHFFLIYFHGSKAVKKFTIDQCWSSQATLYMKEKRLVPNNLQVFHCSLKLVLE